MKLKYLVLIIIVGLLIGAGFVGYPHYQVHLASKAYKSGQLEKAIELCNLLESSGLKNAKLYAIRGQAYTYIQDSNAAIRDMQKSLELDEKNANLHLQLGTVYLAIKNTSAAIDHYTKAIQYDTDLIEAYNNRGAIYTEMEKYILAANDYQKAIEINPERAITYYNLARIYDLTGNIERAFKNYNLFLKYAKPYMKDLLYSANKRIIALEDEVKQIKKADKKSGTRITESAVLMEWNDSSANTLNVNKK